MQLLPLLISLETSEDERVAQDALNLHATLHTKHPSLLNVRYLEFARASYDYQRTITSEVSGQRRGVAVLAGWYSLLSEKRAWRLEFLKAITRAFELDLMGQEEVGAPASRLTTDRPLVRPLPRGEPRCPGLPAPRGGHADYPAIEPGRLGRGRGGQRHGAG